MKRLIGIVALAALVMVSAVSCNKNQPESTTGKYPILFRCSSETRAETTIDSIKLSGFNVHAYFTGNNNSFNFTKAVSYDDEYNVWTYDDIEYWLPGTTYWFKAVYPTSLDYSIDNTTKDQELIIPGFDITSQQDILAATTGGLEVDPTLQAPTTGSIVKLQFQHLLANVTIKVKSQIEGVTIQNIKLSGVDTNCEYSGNAWAISGNTTYIDYKIPTTLSKGADYVDVTGGGILVIPAAANKQLTIEANKIYNLTFPAGTWESGNRYTYTLEIKQDDIVFVDDAPYVEEWDSENATGSVIIK